MKITSIKLVAVVEVVSGLAGLSAVVAALLVEWSRSFYAEENEGLTPASRFYPDQDTHSSTDEVETEP